MFLYYAFVQQSIVTLTELSISCVIFVLPKLYSLEQFNRTVTKAALIEVAHFREYLITEVEPFKPEKLVLKAYTIADHPFLQSGITRVLF